jgi:hypothetical protein
MKRFKRLRARVRARQLEIELLERRAIYWREKYFKAMKYERTTISKED